MNTFRPNLFDSYKIIKKNNFKTISAYLSLEHHNVCFKHSTYKCESPFTFIHNNPVKFICVESKSLIHGLQIFLDNND